MVGNAGTQDEPEGEAVGAGLEGDMVAELVRQPQAQTGQSEFREGTRPTNGFVGPCP